ncbi:MAG: hypothetical protein R3C56_04310 [Pirellulaceae bacterium]
MTCDTFVHRRHGRGVRIEHAYELIRPTSEDGGSAELIVTLAPVRSPASIAQR